MTDKISESVGSQIRDEWRKSFRSSSQGDYQRSSNMEGFTNSLRSRTPSPSPFKSAAEPQKSQRSQSPSRSAGSKDASLGDMPKKLTKKRVTIADTLKKSTGNMSGKMNVSEGELAYIEAEYIKNLQKQIYFLELETNYLREQARKATEMHPQMMQEAENMVSKLKEMQREIDKMELELKKKDFVIQELTSEKGRIEEVLNLEKENHQREKALFTEELVSMKEEKDRLEREIARKNDEIRDIKKEIDRSAAEVDNAERRINTLKAQLEQKIEQHNITQLALEEKRAELLMTEAQLRELEEKYFTNTITVKDKLNEDLRGEIRMLHQKLKEIELEAERGKFLRDKVSDDVASIVRENSSLNQRLAELIKQLEREREFQDSTARRHSESLAELASLKEKLNENNILRDQLKQEQEKSRQYLEQLKNEEASSREYALQINTMQSHLLELERMQKMADFENSELRKEKILLVDHIAELHKKIEDKDREILSLMASTDDMNMSLSNVDLRKSLELTQNSQNWKQLSKVADSMKFLSQSMMAETSHSTKSPRLTASLY